MNKCSWCTFSYNENGVLKCRFSRCSLKAVDIAELLKRIFNTGLK